MIESINILRLLGTGGCASVYLCQDKLSTKLYALKRIPKNRLRTHEQKERFSTEERILLQICHPLILRGYKTIEDDTFRSFLMEYIDGKPLYQCIWTYSTSIDGILRQKCRFPEEITKFYACQVALALEVLHTNGYMHRDLKSGNILITAEGYAKLIDFGYAKQIQKSQEKKSRSHRKNASRKRSFCGTHYIMSPEMFLREENVTESFVSDWWAFGVLIYEMICGRPPWEYKCQENQTLDAYFESIIIASQNVEALLEQQNNLVSQTIDIATTPSDPALSKELIHLLKQLICVDPTQRLGYNGTHEVKNHPWFKDVRWPGFLPTAGKDSIILPPYIPSVKGNDVLGIPTVQTIMQSVVSSTESLSKEDNARFFGDF